MTINLSKLAHIKTVVPDAEKAFKILSKIFGAMKLRNDFVNSSVKVVFVGLGDFILQYIEPQNEQGPWYEHLQSKGPGIFSLAFLAENLDDLVFDLQVKENVKPLISLQGKNREFLLNFPNEFMNSEIKTKYIMDTIEKIGFHIELGEKPSNEEFKYPNAKYATGQDTLIGDASTMLHFELVTSDANDAYEFLHRNFGTEKVELMFSGMLDSDFMHIIHVNLSNQVLQYCQPIAKEGTWNELLIKNGSYVHNLNFLVDDIEETVKKYQQEGFEYIFQQRLTPEDENFFYMINSFDKLGFHMEHGQVPKGEIPKGFLFNELIKE